MEVDSFLLRLESFVCLRVFVACNPILAYGFWLDPKRKQTTLKRGKHIIQIGLIGAGRAGLTHGPSLPQPLMYDLKASNGPLAEVNSHDIDTFPG